MKYRLKKDLPFAKAGTELVLKGEDRIRPSGAEEYLICITEDLPRLIKEGWIEEVKPREWEVYEYDGKLYDAKNMLDPLSLTKFKVKEVIE